MHSVWDIRLSPLENIMACTPSIAPHAYLPGQLSGGRQRGELRELRVSQGKFGDDVREGFTLSIRFHSLSSQRSGGWGGGGGRI